MKDRFVSIASLVIMGVLGLGVWWAAIYTEHAVPLDSRPRYTHEVDGYATSFIYLRSDTQGRLSFRLEGARLEHFPDDDTFFVMAPRAYSQRPDTPVIRLTAGQGLMDQDGARITLTERVHLYRPASEQAQLLDIRSEQMILFPDDEIAKTDTDTQIIHGKSVISGRGMVYNNVTRELSIQQQTRVEIPPRAR